MTLTCENVDLLSSYSKRPDIAADLAILLRKLERASKDERPVGRRSVQREQPPSEQRVCNRLTNDDLRQLIAAFQSGTPKQELAECYSISLSSVKQVLRENKARQKTA